MLFLANEPAKKAEINILKARDTIACVADALNLLYIASAN